LTSRSNSSASSFGDALRSGAFIAVMIRKRTGWEIAIPSFSIGEVGRLCRVGFASFAPILDLRPFA